MINLLDNTQTAKIHIFSVTECSYVSFRTLPSLPVTIRGKSDSEVEEACFITRKNYITFKKL